MKYINILSAVALAALSLSACSTLKEGTHNVTVVSVNDVHGRWFSEPFVDGTPMKGSIMADQALIETIRKGTTAESGKVTSTESKDATSAEHRTVFLIDAGDELSGGEANFYCSWVDSLSEHIYTKIASYMGVDAFIPGPDDISSPAYPRVKKELKKAGIPVLESGEYKILRKDGIKVAIAADTTAAAAAAKKKPALIIAKASAKELPKNAKSIDLVLAAHDHRNWANSKSGVAAIDAGSYARNIGRADIKITKNGRKVEGSEKNEGSLVKVSRGTSKNVKISAPTVNVKDADESMKEAFSSDFEAVKGFVNSKIGVLDTDLVAREGYCGSSAYMNLYHALTLAQEGIDISLCATLSVDGVIKASDIRFRDIAKTLYPFDNKLVVIRMSGKEVKAYLEASYDNWIVTMEDSQTSDGSQSSIVSQSSDDSQSSIVSQNSIGSQSSDGSHIFRLKEMKDFKTGATKLNFAKSPANFDSAGGLCYTVDVTKPLGERVSILSMADGSAFDEAKDYVVGITNYRASGAGGMLAAAGIDPKHLDERMVNLQNREEGAKVAPSGNRDGGTAAQGQEFRTLMYKYIVKNGGLKAALFCDPKVVGSWKFVPEQQAQAALERDLEEIF